MHKLTVWLADNKRTALIGAGVLSAVVVALLAWLTFSMPNTPTPDAQVPSTPPADVQDSGPQNPEEGSGPIEVDDPGPEELPQVDVSPQIAKWEISRLTSIPPTTDPVEFATQFAQFWMAPNYSAYTKTEFSDWVFEHFSPNDHSAVLTNKAEVSIHDQMMPATQWEELSSDKQVQAVQLLSVEEPGWVKDSGRAQSFLRESASNGWPNVHLVETYGMVYTTGLLAGETRFDYADLHRNLYAIKCDPTCGVADVLSNELQRLGGSAHARQIEDFNLAEEQQ